jgi:hypothetical protein
MTSFAVGSAAKEGGFAKGSWVGGRRTGGGHRLRSFGAPVGDNSGVGSVFLAASSGAGAGGGWGSTDCPSCWVRFQAAFIEWRVNGRRGGFVLGGDGAAIRDQAFDGDDHGEGLDLGGHAVAGPFGFQVGDFPEAGQDFVAAQVEPAQFLGILLDELLLNGGTVFNDVGADTRLGFDVSSWIVVETCGC